MRGAVLVFVICALACLVAHVALLRSVVRQGTAAPATDVPGVPRSRLVVELVWAVIPILVLALVLTATWARVRNQVPEPPVIMEVAR